MTQSSKEETHQKWAPIIESLGLTGSKADWMSQYVENVAENNLDLVVVDPTDYNLSPPITLPIVKQVVSKTIDLNLVSVKPMGVNSDEEMDKINKEVKTENRDRKIDAIIDDKDFEEMKVEDHPDYEKMPDSRLLYMDFKYGHKKTRRSKKKKKNKKI